MLIPYEDNSIFKCPFNDFKGCICRRCMAFRADDKTFWCTLIEAYNKTPKNSQHPIEMLNIKDDNW